ncbi:hypothetical protein HYH03_009590 [Edaphochlamys debaryana]|uniref:Ankyrin repeat protein n=1 Tax=Edaphochlamys debaryana TaxID=47281 RepID=A0A835XZY2_9CHLO|nr:hypothetical protein HYH03_009590 [Edaphochlamys debaryana]|eukprot:KAG2492098.1 hypothetical protein HYH03_009590 [Edaphochlamys debaryana]
MLTVAIEATGLAPDLSILLAAAEAGNLAICQWLCEPGRLPHVGHPHLQVLGPAAGRGHTPLCEWAWKAKPRGRNRASLDDYYCFYSVAVQDAAKGGHAETLRWLLQRRGWKYDLASCLLLEAVAEGCDLPLLKELYRGEEDRPTRWELFPRLRKELMAAAVASRTPDWKAKAEWCAEQGCELEASCAIAAILKAISDGRLKGEVAAKRVMWLRERGHESTILDSQSEILAAAIQAGDVVAVRSLLELGLRTAAANWRRCRLDLDLVLALHGAGCDLGPPQNLAEWACEAGQRPILEWLLGTFGEDVVEDDQYCLLCAAWSGDVSLVRWLREHQWGGLGRANAGDGPGGSEGTSAPPMFLDWSPQLLHDLWGEAASSGCEELLELLLEWGCPLPVHEPGEASHVWPAAAWKHDVRTLRVLRRLGGGTGMPWGSDGTFAACVWREGSSWGASLGILQWLLAEGCPVDWGRAESAARERVRHAPRYRYDGEPRAVLEWVIEQRARSESLGGLKRSVRSVGMWAAKKMDAARGLLAAVRRR